MKKILILAALLAFAGCEQKVDDVPQKQDSISIYPETKTFGKDGGALEVAVTSTGEWSLTADGEYDWISVEPESGQDGDVVKFTVASNYTGKELSAVYTFRCGEAETTFTAISESGEVRYLRLDATTVEVASTAVKLEALLHTNLNYRSLNVSVPESNDWLEYSVAMEGENENEVKIGFDLTANEVDEDRMVEVVISPAEDIDDVEPVVLTVIQRKTPRIIPEKTEYVVYPEGGTISVPVDANIEYEVTVKASEGEEWLEYKGNENGAETFVAPAAAADVRRYSTVTFREKNPIEGTEPLTVVVNVRQTPEPLIKKALDMTKARAYPAAWSKSTQSQIGNMRQFTFEALVCPDEFKPDGEIATILGIEGSFLIRLGDTSLSGNRLQVTLSGTYTDDRAVLEAGKWYHIAVVFDNRELEVYLNGELVIYMADTWTNYVNFNVPHNDEVGTSGKRSFWIGYSYDANRDFRGKMSEIRFWNRPLTQEEINAENHFYTVDPSSSGLICYWKLDEGEGNTFKDYTGNGNDLTGQVNVRQGTYVSGDAGAQWVDVALPE